MFLPFVFVTRHSSRVFVFTLTDACIPVDLTVTSLNTTSVTISWVVPKDQNNSFISFVSLFSSVNKTQNYTTTNKELTFTGLSPGSTYSVSISSLCNGTESIPSTIAVQTSKYKTSAQHLLYTAFPYSISRCCTSSLLGPKALTSGNDAPSQKGIPYFPVYKPHFFIGKKGESWGSG